MTYRTRALAILAVIALAACGSGGGSSAMPTTAIAPLAGTPAGAATTAMFTITIPASTTAVAAQRTPAYVSASTQSAVITLTTVNAVAYTGSPTTIATNLTTSNPNCTGSPLTCTVAAPAAAGTDVFVVTTYDQPQTSASPATPVGNVLSQATLSIAVTANQANTAATPLILSGVAATFVISNLPAATLGTAFTSPHAFIVNAKDAGGNTIIGTYLHPVTLSDSDTSGATALATAGSDSPPANTLLSSADTMTLNYTGATIASATISAAASGATTGSGVFTPAAPTLGITSISTGSGAIGTQVSATITGFGFTNTTTVAISGGGETIATTYVSPTSLTVTIFSDPESAGGVRNVRVANGSTTASLANGFNITTAGISIVTLATDSVSGTPAGSGAGATGDLRYVLSNAPAGNTIVFDTTAMGASTITLAGPLPPIEHNLTIDGGYYGRMTIDGASLYRVFFVDTGTVAIANLTLQNALAKGGNGGDNTSYNNSVGPGGGGFGAGACVFVNQVAAAVTISNDFLTHCFAAGGNGGTSMGSSNGGGGEGIGGGGGGLGGNGGSLNPLSNAGVGGGGGGGVLGAGGLSLSNGGGAGGLGGGGGGGGGGCGLNAGAGGAAYGSNSAGAAANTIPGAGGFGGGGGGASICSNSDGGSNGGFGGGGGGGAFGGTNGISGSGGVGGGGAGASGGNQAPGTAGGGGVVAASIHGGAGGAAGASISGPEGQAGSSGGGGGGAAAGAAIFVNAGSLTITNSGAVSASATAGTAGAGGPSISGSHAGTNGSAGTADQTPVFSYGGSVNGTPVAGPVSGALGTTMPTAVARRP